MTVPELLTGLENDGVRLWEEAGALRFRAPQGVMTHDRRAALAEHKNQVLEYLRQRAGQARAQVSPRPAERHEPFPLTEVQAAYLLGRRDAFRYGGVPCHGYGEIAIPSLEPGRLEEAWRALVRRHDMLRAVIDLSGTQRLLPDVPDYRIEVIDMRGLDAARAAARIEAVRAEMSHRVYQPGEWPLFDVRVSLSRDGDLLHFSIDFLIADFVSTQLLLDELLRLYHDPGLTLPPIGISFRDYLLAERELHQGARYKRDQGYWMELVDQLPPAPYLPVLDGHSGGDDGQVRFRRWQLVLSPPDWAALRARAGEQGVTASVGILSAYAETIARWCGRRFTLDLTIQNRLPLHPHAGRLVGDFTSVELLAIDQDPAASLAERARAVQARLWADLDHRLFSGLEVMREVARRRGPGSALFPVVFTSAVGVDAGYGGSSGGIGQLVYGITQTPQVWIDCQVMESADALALNWDVREGVLPDGLIDDMFAAFGGLLRRMATSDDVWGEREPVALPAAQLVRRRTANATQARLPDGLLHDRVLAQARRTPDRIAVTGTTGTLTYQELVARSASVAQAAREAGCGPRDVVAIMLEKGCDQPVAVLGVLLAGAAYLPVDTDQPPARRNQILSDAGVRCVVTHSCLPVAEWPPGVRRIHADALVPSAASQVRPEPSAQPGDLAYVIYTSGSTGTPKGVMISHRSALNTVADINHRFDVGAQDRVLGLASLGFDLSVYDIFGPLAAGGALVLPANDRRADPSHWADLIATYQVTVWNSVPAQMQMLCDYLTTAGSAEDAASLRLALLSGDWIPVQLPSQIRGLLPRIQLISLGGATEAAIWSIFFPIGQVPDRWIRIPYGRPLANQSFHVLDETLRPSPDWVSGELYIGGTGLALGYLGDEEKTRERFIRDPVTGSRLYRTGDLGRYLADGVIEFLGRADRQVKIRGHRIELAEVEEAIRSHPAVGAAVALVDGEKPLERRLVAFAEPARRPAPSAADYPAQLQDLPRQAEEAAAAAVAGVDRDRYQEYMRSLDEAAIASMAAALGDLGLSAGNRASLDTACEAVLPRHRRLVRRWARVLEASGGWRSGLPVSAADADRLWERTAGLADVAGSQDIVGYFRESARRLPAQLRGETDPLQLFLPDGRMDVAQAIYTAPVEVRWANRAMAELLMRLAWQRSRLRVLEVGAGTGATSAEILAALGGRLDEYVYSEISRFFLGVFQERFGRQPQLRFATYDLNDDYRAHGILPNSFDLVIAGDVLHAARDINFALARLTELLIPGGWLVFTEMTRESPAVMASLELLQDDVADERAETGQTFLSSRQWRRKCAALGADQVICLPVSDDLAAMSGMTVVAARLKADRVPVTAQELLSMAGDRLPEYMVPAQLQVVDALPLTSNGKIDYAALRSWLVEPGAAAAPLGVTQAGRPAGEAGQREMRVASIWAEVFGLGDTVLPLHQGFLQMGGESLLAARLAGRLREENPEAAQVRFDVLLRQILEDVTVAELAARLPGLAVAPSEQTRAVVSPVRRLGGPEGAHVRVLVHDGSGTLSCYDELRHGLAGDGPLVGLVASDSERWLRHDPAVLIERLADEYAEALMDAECLSLDLVGAGVGCLLAVEVARRLTESGGAVHGLFLLGGWPLPGDRRHDPGPSPPPGAGDLPQHLAAAVWDLDVLPYAGDITLVWRPGEPVPREQVVSFWAQVCLGDLNVVAPDEGPAGVVAALTSRNLR